VCEDIRKKIEAEVSRLSGLCETHYLYARIEKPMFTGKVVVQMAPLRQRISAETDRFVLLVEVRGKEIRDFTDVSGLVTTALSNFEMARQRLESTKGGGGNA